MKDIEGISIETSTSFIIRIKYRQNTSWQGSIQWLGGKQKKHFRSCLELIMLIEQVLNSDVAKGKRIEFHTCDGKDEEQSRI